MFESMSAFLWCFFIAFGLILTGILFEEKLIAFEDAVWEIIRRFIHNKRNHKSNRA